MNPLKTHCFSFRSAGTRYVRFFCINFDLARKVMKDILVQYYAITGFVAGSPREVLRESFQAGMIQGDEWLTMLKTRNQLAHDYDGKIVKA